MGDSNLEPAGVLSDAIRSILSFLDRPAYLLLGLVYQLFFNVASADLFSNGTILAFYKRVQLIIGVFMMFQLAMTILKGIVNPDTFTDSKTGGAALIKRIAISLILLTVLVPINIPGAKNEWERQLNNNGLLFGALYSLQHRILDNNTLGRLILGTNDSAESFTESDPNDKDSSLAKSSRIFTSTVLKGFYRINLIEEENRKHEDGKDDAIFNENRVCKDIDDEVLAAYTRLDADPGEIISMVNITCDKDESLLGLIPGLGDVYKKLSGKTMYVFAYTGFISMIVAFVFVFILLSFTIDVAVRAVKLAVLRLLAPIPIISYMDPKGGKDATFNAWVKTLTSTYLDLFIRLSVVYFIIFLIQDMIVHGIVINTGSGILGVFSMILIWIGLFIFAKQAPKFIKDVLGLKNDPGKLFGGFGELAGAAAVGAGAIGSFNAARQGSRMADITNKKDANSILNRGKHLAAGILGGVTGVGAGMSAWSGAKDHAGKAVMQAYQQRNATKYSQGDAGSTLLGRAGTTLSRAFTGESIAARRDRDIANMQSRQKALDAIKKRVSGEMVKQDWTNGDLGIATDNAGNAIGKVNYKSFMAEYAAAQSRGDGRVTFKDASGVSHEISFADADRQKGFLLKNNEDSYIRQVVAGTQSDAELQSLIADATAKGGAEVKDANGNVLYRPTVSGRITSRDDITKSSEAIGQVVRDAQRANAKAKADDLYAGKK